MYVEITAKSCKTNFEKISKLWNQEENLLNEYWFNSWCMVNHILKKFDTETVNSIKNLIKIKYMKKLTPPSTKTTR